MKKGGRTAPLVASYYDFLSHAHAEKPAAQALRRALEDRGVGVWEDVLELRAGDRLDDLEREVKGARGLLLLWTPAAAESVWVEREAGWAQEARAANPEYRIQGAVELSLLLESLAGSKAV